MPVAVPGPVTIEIGNGDLVDLSDSTKRLDVVYDSANDMLTLDPVVGLPGASTLTLNPTIFAAKAYRVQARIEELDLGVIEKLTADGSSYIDYRSDNSTVTVTTPLGFIIFDFDLWAALADVLDANPASVDGALAQLGL